MSMKQIAGWVLDVATARGASYADLRVIEDRHRILGTKNGKVAHASETESFGIGIRVLVNEAWGFSSTNALSRESVERAAAHAIEIARASARVKEQPIRLAAEKPVVADW